MKYLLYNNYQWPSVHPKKRVSVQLRLFKQIRIWLASRASDETNQCRSGQPAAVIPSGYLFKRRYCGGYSVNSLMMTIEKHL